MYNFTYVYAMFEISLKSKVHNKKQQDFTQVKARDMKIIWQWESDFIVTSPTLFEFWGKFKLTNSNLLIQT